jgi:hypothetical protein
MQRSLAALAAAVALLLGSAGQSTAGPVSFNFQFDNGGQNEPDGTVTPPIVGTGTFTIPNDPGNGTFTLASLTGFSMSYTFGTDMYSQADIQSDNTLTEVVIGDFGGGQRRAYFTDPGGPNGANGPFGGSLDLVNAEQDGLSFEPANFGGHNLYFESSASPNGNNFMGNYLGLTPSPGPATVPEPAGVTLLVPGVSGLALRAWRKRRTAA